MLFSDHALLRFVQRIIGIEDEAKALTYLAENKFNIYYHFLMLINESEILMSSFSPQGGGPTYKYMINGDTLVVISTSNNTVITLYDIKVDSNNSINSIKIERYTKIIRRNNAFAKKHEAQRKENDLKSRKLEYLIDYLNTHLAAEFPLGQHIEQLKSELEQSIQYSVDLAANSKKLKHQNRELMIKVMYGFKRFSEKEEVANNEKC